MFNGNKDLYEFGNFQLNVAERILWRDGNPIRLAPKTFDLLLVLIKSGNRVVGKEELMQAVWADAFVEEANLSVHISSLRKILGNGSGDNGYIETIPKRGYRLIAEVRKVALEDESTEQKKPLTNEFALAPTNDFPPSQGSPNENGGAIDQAFKTEMRAENSERAAEAAPSFAAINSSGAPAKHFLPDAASADDARRNRRFFVLSLLIFSLLGGGAYFLYKFSKSRAAFEQMKIARISDTGKTVEAAISPDGKYLAHVARDAGKQSLHVKHIGTNSAVQIVAPAAVSFSPLTFSADGGYVFYVLRQPGAPPALYRIPVLGGEPKKILENVAGAISLAPDGERFAFVREISDGETALLIADLSGNVEKQIAARRKPEHFNPNGAAWSPDGKIIACSGGSASGERLSNIFAFAVAGGAERTVSDRKWRAVDRAAWLADGSALVVPAMDARGQEAFQIWEFPFPAGEPRRITNDLNDYGGISLTANGDTLVTIQFQIRRNIWLISDLAAGQAVSLTDGANDSFRFVAWMPDGKILYPSLASGTRDIWTMNADGSNRRQLTATEHNDILPSASPDDRYIVFASNRDARGTVNVWRMNADGSNAVQLTRGADESAPQVTPDGKFVIYVAGGNDGEPEKRTVWKVPIEGGEPVQLIAKPSYGFDVSPDGARLVCRYKENQNAAWRVAVFPIEGGEPTQFLDVPPGSQLRWSPDNSAIAFIKTQNSVSNIWSQPLGGGAPRQLTNFATEQILNFDWSSDNRIVCSRGVTTQEAISISDFR